MAIPAVEGVAGGDPVQLIPVDAVGLDVVELNPSRDPSGITAAAAVKIIKEVAGLMIKKSI